MKTRRFLFLSLLLLLAILFPFIPSGYSTDNTTIFVDPQNSYPFPQENFTITIQLSNVTNLHECQFALIFNSSIIKCVEVQVPVDNIFQSFSQLFNPPPIIDNNKGLVVKFLGIESPADGTVNGSGKIAQIKFTALTTGKSYLNFTNRDALYNGTYLRDPAGNYLTFDWTNGTAQISEPEEKITIPFYYQEKTYYSGPAALQMVFDYYGEAIPQQEIAEVARTFPNITYPDELRRAGHFSNLSTSMGDEISGNITGYSLRKYGYGAFEKYGLTLHELKDAVRQGYPVIVSTWYDLSMQKSHYRVVVGYNATHIIVQDPWNKTAWAGSYGGPETAIEYDTFLSLWNYSNYWGLFVHPWTATVKTQMIEPDIFKITANITYPVHDAFFDTNYSTYQSNAKITVPAGLTLQEGSAMEPLNSGTLLPGETVQVSWVVAIDTPGRYVLTIEASGIVNGSVNSHGEYPEYTYQDRLLAKTSVSIECWWANPFNVSKNGQNYTVVIFSNSTITDFNYSDTLEEITFNATGPDVTIGSCCVSIPKDFINSTYFAVFVDSVVTPSILAENSTHSFISFTYNHSTHRIKILPSGPGDINGDRKVDIRDIAIVAAAFGSYLGHPRWNPIADINYDNKIDIRDIAFVAANYGNIY